LLHSALSYQQLVEPVVVEPIEPDLAAEQVELVEPVSAEQVVPALVAVPVEPEPAVEQVEPEPEIEPESLL